MLQNKHKNKFDRLCSGLNILVSRHLIILKSLTFSPGISRSIGQLHNPFADIGSYKEILYEIIHLSRFPKLRLKIHLVIRQFKDVEAG